MRKNYTCPVCGYDKIENPIYDSRGYGTDEICCCCGFHFGCDDYPKKEEAFIKWRNNWITNGCKWWAYREAPPKGWDPKKQLTNIKKILDQAGFWGSLFISRLLFLACFLFAEI